MGPDTDGLEVSDSPHEVVDFDHIGMRVSDLDESLAFYHDLLGLPIRDRERYENGELPFVALVAGGRHIHLFPSDEPIDADELDHFCVLLRSNDVDSRQELRDLVVELENEGVEVDGGVEPAERIGAYGMHWGAYVRDPDGRRVELKMH